jgi:pyruvate formate lyase activating enzyme
LATVFNIQRFSVQDGPGIRTTVFLKGCPLRCVWCSNPESQNAFPELAHSKALCLQCGRCVTACTVGALSLTERDGLLIDRRSCTNCGRCVAICTANALKLYGREMTAEEVFKEVRRDRDFYRNSGGGVTASGGEALCQPEFVTELFELCRAEYIHTCLDTCGDVAPGVWKMVLPHVDLVLLDVKHFDPVEHRRLTGRSNEVVEESLRVVSESGVRLVVRVPIVPGVNDSEDNLRGIARMVASVGGIEEVDLLAYHRLGLSKYEMLGREYGLSELLPLDHDGLGKYVPIFESFGLATRVEM